MYYFYPYITINATLQTFLDITELGNNSFIPFLILTGDGVQILPSVDDGSYPISLPEPLPLGDTHEVATYTTAYVS